MTRSLPSAITIPTVTVKDEIPLAGSIIGWNDQVERFIINSFIYCDLDTNISAGAEGNVGYLLNDKNRYCGK